MNHCTINVKHRLKNFLAWFLRYSPLCTMKIEVCDNDTVLAKKTISVVGKYVDESVDINAEFSIKLDTIRNVTLKATVVSLFGNKVTTRDDNPLYFECYLGLHDEHIKINVRYEVYRTEEDKTHVTGHSRKLRFHLDTDVIRNNCSLALRRTDMILMS